MKTKIILVLIVSFLVGCATTKPADENVCEKGNWKEVGLADGLVGEPAEQVTVRLHQCEAKGKALDSAQYTEGYVEGIQKYCSYKGGKKAGEKGKPYKPGTCPIELSDEFVRGYQEGHDLWEANRAMKQAQRGSRSIGDGY